MIDSSNSSAFLKELETYGAGLREQILETEDSLAKDKTSIARRTDRARKDYKYFCRTYFPHYITSSNFSEFQKFVFDSYPHWVAAPGYKQSLAAPRGSAKSTIITQIGIIYAIVHDLHSMIMLIMDTETQSAEMLESIKAELDSNPRLAGDYPKACGIGRTWKALEIITRHNVKVKIGSTLKRIRGTKHGAKRPSLIILDDIENDENVVSKTQRDKLESWLDGAVMNLGPPDGSLVCLYVGTILHHDAVFVRTAKKPGWKSKKFQSIRKWPNRMDLWETWEKIYQADEAAGDTFYRKNKKEMFQGCEVDWSGVRPLLQLMKIRAVNHDSFDCEQQNEPNKSNERVSSITFFDLKDVPAGCTTVGAVDTSLGKTITSDPCAILTGKYHRQSGILYVIDALVARLKPDVQIKEIIQRQAKIHCINWAVEAVQFQHFFAESLLKESIKAGHPVPVIPVIPKDSKDNRILSVFPFVNSGHVRFLRGQTVLLEQIKHWPEAAHDDGPDCLSMLHKQAVSMCVVPEFSAVTTNEEDEEFNDLNW